MKNAITPQEHFLRMTISSFRARAPAKQSNEIASSLVLLAMTTFFGCYYISMTAKFQIKKQILF
jgi:hypothetical protein